MFKQTNLVKVAEQYCCRGPYHKGPYGYTNSKQCINFAKYLIFLKKKLKIRDKIGLVANGKSGLCLAQSASVLYPKHFRTIVVYNDTEDWDITPTENEILHDQYVKDLNHFWFVDDDIVSGRTLQEAYAIYPFNIAVILRVATSDGVFTKNSVEEDVKLFLQKEKDIFLDKVFVLSTRATLNLIERAILFAGIEDR